MKLRIRGIYATALTQCFREAGAEVVQASLAIRERFGNKFASDEYSVAVETTDDRQGVGIHGDPAEVNTVANNLVDLEADAMSWAADLPCEAVFSGRVAETLGGGAVVNCGGSSGFLPYANTDRRVEEGDRLRVQVSDPAPPWSDTRAVLDTRLEVGGGLVRLVRDGSATMSSQPGMAADMTAVLPVDPPDGWRARWTDASEDAELDGLADALAAASERASVIEAELAETPENTSQPGVRWSGRATTWVWFGRASRFALDDRRRNVCPTMAGHHRIKAGSANASAGVDFAEAVCDPGILESEFPFEVVIRQFGPHEGDSLRIVHGKPDGSRIVLGEGEITDRDGSTVTVRREMTPGGTYDALGTERRAGDVAVTTLTEGKRWYPTVYRGSDGEHRGTYVNICTPVEIFPDTARYIDLHVDVVKHADGRIERVDDAELDAAVSKGHISESLAKTARTVADRLENTV